MRRTALLLSLLALLTPSVRASSAPVITTVAGGGPDGVPALSVNLSMNDLAVDGAGSIYFPSLIEHRLFRIDPSGMLTVAAGTGIERSLGDGGPAGRASFLLPHQVALAASGDLLVYEGVEFEECCDPFPVVWRAGLRVRRIDAVSGTIQTVAGTGTLGFVSSPVAAEVAPLGAPTDLVGSAAGDLFVAEWYYPPFDFFPPLGAIHRIDAGTGTMSHFAGNLSASGGPVDDGRPATEVSLQWFTRLAPDPAGGLFVSDLEHRRIRRVDLATGIITTYAGNGTPSSTGDGGPALQASVTPGPLATDSAGNLYLLEGARVRRVDAASGIITTVAGEGTAGFSGDGGPAVAAQISARHMTVDPAGNLYLATYDSVGSTGARIRRVNASDGTIQTVAGDPAADFFGVGGPATQARLRHPADVDVAPNGDLYIADAGQRSIRKVDAATRRMTSLLRGAASGLGSRAHPFGVFGVAVHPNGEVYYVEMSSPDDWFGYTGQNYVFRLDPVTGQETRVAGLGFPSSSGDGGPAADAGISQPTDLAFDQDGNLFIAETGADLIRRIDGQTGIITTVAGKGTAGDGSPAIEARLHDPGGVGIDPQGNLLIADTGHNRIRRVDAATGIITTVAGNGTAGFSGDGGPAVDASITAGRVAVDGGGDIYISGGDRVRRVDTATGIIRTIAGDGSFGFHGDGGPPTLAALGGPTGIDVDAEGNLYIAAFAAGRVRRVTPPPSSELMVTIDPPVLWPPGHQMIEARASVSPGPGFVPAQIVLESITSSEPDDAAGGGDGRTTDDIQAAAIGEADFDFSLRAERDSHGEGRVYAITYRATDADGNAARGTGLAMVPHDRGGRTEPVEIVASQTPAGTLLEWTPVPGAFFYSVVRGGLEGLGEAGGVIDLGAVACIEAGSEDTSTVDAEDAAIPSAGSGFFYLVEYDDGRRSGFGSEAADLPRVVSSGGCR